MIFFVLRMFVKDIFLFMLLCISYNESVYYDILLSESNAKVKEEKPAWIAIYAISVLQYKQQCGPTRAKAKLFE